MDRACSSNPCRKIRSLRTDSRRWQDSPTEAATERLATLMKADGLAGIAVDFIPGDAKQFGVRIRHGDSEETTITCDLPAGELALDRSRSASAGLRRRSLAFIALDRAGRWASQIGGPLRRLIGGGVRE